MAFALSARGFTHAAVSEKNAPVSRSWFLKMRRFAQAHETRPQAIRSLLYDGKFKSRIRRCPCLLRTGKRAG
jgi:hypothetical protein